MKKLILCMVVLTIASFSNAQNVNIPDANFKNALISAGVDTNGDGEISYTEAEAITNLNVYGIIACGAGCYGQGEITSLEGIEAFKNIDTLVCSGNRLTSLDLSNNTYLKVLNCSANRLTNLDLSNNTALEYLDCNINKLTNLNVTKNTALKYLSCGKARGESNPLTTLDVSGCTSLTELRCNFNNLISLNVSGCTALTVLWCVVNKLTSLDVSSCTALKYLNCCANNLISLNVSGCTALTYLNLVDMPTLYEVCVWEGFNPDSLIHGCNIYNSPNVYFTSECSATGLNTYKKNSMIDIYPNPSNDIINIAIENPDNAIIKIYNVNGMLVFSKAPESKVEKIDISGYPKGIYIIKVMQDNTVNVGKVVLK